MYKKNLKRLTIFSIAGLFILICLFIYIINAAPAVKSLYGNVSWANLQIDKQKTLADLAVLSKTIITRFHQTEEMTQSVINVVLILDIFGITVSFISLFIIRRLKAELKEKREGLHLNT